MNGQLSEHPLAELLKEISEKGFPGALRLENQRMKCVFYFDNGKLVYAASNARNLRLREYLIRQGVASEEEMTKLGDRRPDLEVGELLCKEQRLTRSELNRLVTKQVSDVVRLGVPWTEGTWEFDSRSRLKEKIEIDIDLPALLLEASRTIAAEFVANRFRNPAEIISPTTLPAELPNLLPEEGFLLYRLDRPVSLPEVIALSGQNERDALRLTYALSLAGLLLRERWHYAFRTEPPPPPRKEEAISPPVTVTNERGSKEADPKDDLEAFLKHINTATSHYQVLNVANDATSFEIKGAYYELARRFHPDHYRQERDTNLKSRIDSAFARVTQAYDVLSEPTPRANYDSKLDSQARAADFAESAPKATEKQDSEQHQDETSDQTNVKVEAKPNDEAAEEQFKQGFAAYQLGQLNVALGFLSAAARSKPDEGRYRAYYGQALAKNANSKHKAESELQAAVKLDPTNPDYRVMLAELYIDLGFGVRARGEVDRALAKAPNHQKARELLGKLK